MIVPTPMHKLRFVYVLGTILLFFLFSVHKTPAIDVLFVTDSRISTLFFVCLLSYLCFILVEVPNEQRKEQKENNGVQYIIHNVKPHTQHNTQSDSELSAYFRNLFPFSSGESEGFFSFFLC